MKKALVVGAVAIAAFVLLTGFGGHHRGPFHHDAAKMRKHLDFRINDILDDLNATEAQRSQIHAIKDRLHAELEGTASQRQAAREAVHQEWRSARPDAARLHALVDQHLDAARAVLHKAVDAFVEVHAVLTPEQRAQLEEKLPAHGH
ncbi:MAG: Spy/CpxP family protein refolding chaperone [Myxococcales bacterium]